MEKKLSTVKYVSCVALILLIMGASTSQATILNLYGDSLSTSNGGMISQGEKWGTDTGEPGFGVTWAITQLNATTWHYEYTFQIGNGSDLTGGLVSHMIITLSEDFPESDLFNTGSDVDDVEFGTFGADSGNPGFPPGKSISGVKFEMDNEDKTVVAVEFDSTHMPMWGDFYAKDGNPNAAWNADLGVSMTPEEMHANTTELFKVAVPNTVPEPATLAILGLGGLSLLRTTKRYY